MFESARESIYKAIASIRLVDPHTHINPHAPASTTLADILGYHYYTELVHSAGMPKSEIEEDGIEPRELVRRLVRGLPNIENTANYQWLISICKTFFDFQDDRITESNWESLYDAAEEKMSYAQWPQMVLDKSNVESVFLTNDFDDPLEGFDTNTYIPCLRTDDLVFHLGKHETRERLAACSGIELDGSLESLRASLRQRFEHFVPAGARACAISIPPDFQPVRVPDGRAATALDEVLRKGNQADAAHQVALSRRVFWTLAELCDEFDLPFDLMIGVNRGVYPSGVYQGQDLYDSRVSLVQYRELFNAFPDVKFPVSVLASVTNQELVSYAWIFPNVITNGHWWYSNTPSFIARDAAARLEAVPKNKQIGYYSDAYKLEFVWAKFDMYRQILADILAEHFVGSCGWSEERAVELGYQVLRGNVDTIFPNRADPSGENIPRFDAREALELTGAGAAGAGLATGAGLVATGLAGATNTQSEAELDEVSEPETFDPVEPNDEQEINEQEINEQEINEQEINEQEINEQEINEEEINEEEIVEEEIVEEEIVEEEIVEEPLLKEIALDETEVDSPELNEEVAEVADEEVEQEESSGLFGMPGAIAGAGAALAAGAIGLVEVGEGAEAQSDDEADEIGTAEEQDDSDPEPVDEPLAVETEYEDEIEVEEADEYEEVEYEQEDEIEVEAEDEEEVVDESEEYEYEEVDDNDSDEEEVEEETEYEEEPEYEEVADDEVADDEVADDEVEYEYEEELEEEASEDEDEYEDVEEVELDPSPSDEEIQSADVDDVELSGFGAGILPGPGAENLEIDSEPLDVGNLLDDELQGVADEVNVAAGENEIRMLRGEDGFTPDEDSLQLNRHPVTGELIFGDASSAGDEADGEKAKVDPIEDLESMIQKTVGLDESTRLDQTIELDQILGSDNDAIDFDDLEEPS